MVNKFMTVFLMIGFITMTQSVLANLSQKPMAYASPLDETVIANQLNSYHKQGKTFKFNIKELKNSWQLYFIADYQYKSIKQSPYFYFQTPVVLKFNENNYSITQGCQSLKGNYRWSAMDIGSFMTDNVVYENKPCSFDKTAIERTNERLGFPQFFPVKLNGKTEKVLIFKGENTYGDGQVFVFRKLPF